MAKNKTKVLYAQNQKEALVMFRRTSPDMYVPIKAKYAGTKHGARVYLVSYRLRKGEY